MTREEAGHTLIHIYRQCMWTKECDEYGCAVCEDALNMAIEALQTIDNCDQCEWCCPSDGTPTIHVVRCKDCKWYISQESYDNSGKCTYRVRNFLYCKDDDFCSYAERREP